MTRINGWVEGTLGPVRRPILRSPAQTMSLGFAAGIGLGTLALMLPGSRVDGSGASPLVALFTSTSAFCSTGLSTVDMPRYFSTWGSIVVAVLIQVGGFGIMTLASLFGVLIARRLGLRALIATAAETNTVQLGDVRSILIGVVKVTFLTETLVAAALALRFWLGYDESPGRAVFLGVLHSVSAFNNAGFAWFSDSLISFVSDPWICLPINVGVIVGGIGFPVLFELRKVTLRPRLWTLNTRLTVWGSVMLLVGGTVAITAVEWGNPGTLGPLSPGGKLLAGFTQAVQPRTTGFNSISLDQLHPVTTFTMTTLMFIGGGAASTAGGIKISTFLLLWYVMWAEVRGMVDVEIGGWRIGARALRQALTVALLSIGLVLLSTLLLMLLEPVGLNAAMFEVVSAFATAGEDAGLTARLGVPGQVLIMLLMFIGRVGPVTLVTALAVRERQHFYRLPEGRPLIG